MTDFLVPSSKEIVKVDGNGATTMQVSGCSSSMHNYGPLAKRQTSLCFVMGASMFSIFFLSTVVMVRPSKEMPSLLHTTARARESGVVGGKECDQTFFSLKCTVKLWSRLTKAYKDDTIA